MWRSVNLGEKIVHCWFRMFTSYPFRYSKMPIDDVWSWRGYLLLLMTMRMPYLGFHAKFFECNQSNKENFHSANFKETRNLKKWKNIYDIFKYHHTQYNNNNMWLIFFLANFEIAIFEISKAFYDWVLRITQKPYKFKTKLKSHSRSTRS